MARILLCAIALWWCQLAAIAQGTQFRGDGALGRILLTDDGYWPTFERYERPPWSTAMFMRFLTVPQTETPWVSGKDVCFVYRGKAGDQVAVIGSWSNWAQQDPLELLDPRLNRGLFVLPVSAKPGKRYEYRLIVNGEVILDPTNPRGVRNQAGSENNWFAVLDRQPIIVPAKTKAQKKTKRAK